MNDEVQEVKELAKRDHRHSKKVKIVKFGGQYTIRIPKAYAEEVELKPERDKFEFEVEVPSSHKEKGILQGKLVRGK